MLYFILLVFFTAHNFGGIAYKEGFLAPPRYFRYQVSIEVTGLYQVCEGALIKLNCVLTAAYCLQNHKKEDMEVRAGTTTPIKKGETAKIRDIVKHPNFNNKTLAYNIAIVFLAKEFTQNLINPIAMASAADKLQDNDFLVISIWGTDLPRKPKSNLRYVTMTVLNQKICTMAYENTIPITDSNFCAENDGYICDSASGGPVMALGKLVGIVSFDQGCTYQRYPAVYMSIANLRSWIDQHVK